MKKMILFLAMLLTFTANAALHLGLEAQELSGPGAISDKDSEGDFKQVDIKCPPQFVVTRVSAQASYWGTYPAITWFNIECHHLHATSAIPNNHVYLSVGIKKPVTGRTPLAYDSVNYCAKLDADGRYVAEHGAYLTQLNMRSDAYLKVYRLLQCQSAQVSRETEDVEITTPNSLQRQDVFPPRGDIFGEHNHVIRCEGSRKVMTGFRFRYRVDRDEVAFTAMRAFCSKLVVLP
jgi:hypothetical protein